MKYDGQLLEAGRILPTATSILIALPPSAGIDELASGLALYLALEQAGKKVAIATDGVIKVGHSHLFGIGQVQNKIPSGTGGNFTITLGGVVAPDKTVPSLQSLDWAPSGAEQKDLKLTFYVNAGQKFEPTFVTPAYDSSGFDLIFVIGTGNLANLGSIYSSNTQAFNGAHILNIDNKEGNEQFGASNAVDTSASSLSEILAQVLPGLQLPFEGDIATNLLAGIFEATCNLQSEKVTADTYGVVANLLKVGGQRPNIVSTLVRPVQPEVPTGQSQGLPPDPASEASAKGGFDLSKIFNAPQDSFPMPPVISDTSSMPSAEEAPVGEVAITTPEDDWLTPKIFKGKTGLG
ncbi:hypothetical protein A2617_04515 [Candidatus Daviesbacteria bacterium RIFOXYD1_FULL_41_10]|uniref:Uncharacterized protein n=1 Tax=Candidatus Daviesbacteria bacterium RIFOXYD1_FULL_41_10 TaxID=1797801 RepID=A0A1F5N100_9BACT|nr:MAG: hypothetical protein A2617_04515 [Candidatus Daviesbacteria bacterium RIFOXYD1_FULL_41_10]